MRSGAVRKEKIIDIPDTGRTLRRKVRRSIRADGCVEPELLLVDRPLHIVCEDSHRQPSSVSASAHATAASFPREHRRAAIATRPASAAIAAKVKGLETGGQHPTGLTFP